MQLKDLLPIRRGERGVSARREEEGHPFFALQQRMNEMFDSFFRDFAIEPFGEVREQFAPHIDVKEDEKTFIITAELPGMDDKDIDILLERNMVTLKGEKKEEKEEKEENYWHVERRYGSFQRVIPLPEEVDTDKASATFKKGILHITVPKTEQAKAAVKKITVKTE
ncbi:MAG: Hsp20/alpha crystallin family protein [Deltaproteobacteria bacterium]|nr:Hsp20/alpha crystallin family protein [Deltaproteobacteria bacterium]MBN2686693.1 Hsp20/alpha crystallin family protein [Deltaproteobacteria bacterium]